MRSTFGADNIVNFADKTSNPIITAPCPGDERTKKRQPFAHPPGATSDVSGIGNDGDTPLMAVRGFHMLACQSVLQCLPARSEAITLGKKVNRQPVRSGCWLDFSSQSLSHSVCTRQWPSPVEAWNKSGVHVCMERPCHGSDSLVELTEDTVRPDAVPLHCCHALGASQFGCDLLWYRGRSVRDTEKLIRSFATPSTHTQIHAHLQHRVPF